MSALTTRLSGIKTARNAATGRRDLIRGTSQPALQAHSIVSACVALGDVILLFLVVHGFVTIASDVGLSLSLHDRLVYTIFGILAAAAVGARRGLYDIVHFLRPRRAVTRALPPLAAAIFATSFALAASAGPTRYLPLLAVASFAAGAAMLALSRKLCARCVNYGLLHGQLRYRVAIVGGGSEMVMDEIAAQQSPFVEVANVFDGAGPRPENPTQSFGDLLSQARAERIDAIILAYAPKDAERLQLAFTTLRCSVADIFLAGALTGCGMLPAGHPLSSLPLLPAQRRAMTDIDTAVKGIVDRLAGYALLAFLAPVFAVVALAIKLDSRGPVFFKQPRLGYNNAVFMMYKFRSMYDHAADRLAVKQTARDDPRVTRVGRIIRRYSLDELPQLLNVVRGEMSIVGPRPHAPGTNIEGLLLEHVAAGYPLRHRVLPGITGWAQINGSRGMLSSPDQIKRRVKLDLEYIDQWSLLLDLRIVWLTAVREIWSRNAF